jgi:type IV secretory pathway TrbD component
VTMKPRRIDSVRKWAGRSTSCAPISRPRSWRQKPHHASESQNSPGGGSRFREHAPSGPTAIVGFGVALWLLAAARKRGDGVQDVTLPLRESSASLVETATRVFRERAETKQREFMGAHRHILRKARRCSLTRSNRSWRM